MSRYHPYLSVNRYRPDIPTYDLNGEDDIPQSTFIPHDTVESIKDGSGEVTTTPREYKLYEIDQAMFSSLMHKPKVPYYGRQGNRTSRLKSYHDKKGRFGFSNSYRRLAYARVDSAKMEDKTQMNVVLNVGLSPDDDLDAIGIDALEACASKCFSTLSRFNWDIREYQRFELQVIVYPRCTPATTLKRWVFGKGTSESSGINFMIRLNPSELQKTFKGANFHKKCINICRVLIEHEFDSWKETINNKN